MKRDWSKNKSVNKRVLSRVISEALDITYGNREGLANHIVTVVLDSITRGLRRGETVWIKGFGEFGVFQRRAWPTCHLGPGKAGYYVNTYPSCKRVYFIPDADFAKTLAASPSGGLP